MSSIHRFQKAVTSALVALFMVAAAPATKASTPESTSIADRLESASHLLATRAHVLDAMQIEALSNTVGDALETSHYGLQTSALRLVIAYADVVNFDRATAIDVVKLYRNHEDDRVRRMTVVALGVLDDSWGMDFLQRSLRFEQNKQVKHTIAAVLANARA